MNEAATQAACFRHVVFPDGAGGIGRAAAPAPREAAGPFPCALPPGRAGDPIAPETESLFRDLFSQAGPSFRQYKTETLNRRLPACLRALRATSPAHAASVLQRSPHLAAPALDALLIGVTGFFRDQAVFDSLRDKTLPGLLAGCSDDESARPLRVWCAGCSDGAELYTVAMLLAEAGAPPGGRVELLGTDCRAGAVARAAAGVFEPDAVKAVPPALLRRHFGFDGLRYRAGPALRAAVRWRRGDVLAGPEPGPWDLVLCRNLAIYLQPDATASLWAALTAALRPGGVLVLGKAERPLGAPGLAPEGPCMWRRVGGE